MMRSILTRSIPGQAVIQLTDHCNALCPQCGMRQTEPFRRSTIPLDEVKRIIDAAATRGVRAISFTGGEPFLFFDELARLIEHATSAGIPYVRTGTNGFTFMNSRHPEFTRRVTGIAERLAKTKLYTLWISLDSADPAVHESMRGLPGVIEGIEKALPIFHAHGIYPSANLGINRNTGGRWTSAAIRARDWYWHFRWAFPEFFVFVESLGFTIVNACYPMSSRTNADAVYRAGTDDDVVHFPGAARQAVYQALFDSIPAYRARLRIFTPRSSLHALILQHGGDVHAAYSCRGGREFFFIDARSGDAFPCGYRGGENLGKYWELPLRPGDTGHCRKCDWECFRDPSELLGPLHDLLVRPQRLAAKLVRDPEFFSLWWEDLRYYRACGFFNGRTAPDSRKLSRFGPVSARFDRAGGMGQPSALAGNTLHTAEGGTGR